MPIYFTTNTKVLVSTHNFRTTESTNYIAQAVQNSNKPNLYDATSIYISKVCYT